MAIDTEDKRRSVFSFLGVKIAPVADGTIDQPDRQHLFVYRGIAAGGVTMPVLAYHHLQRGERK